MAFEKRVLELRNKFEMSRDEMIRKEQELKSAESEMARVCNISTVAEARKELPIISRKEEVLEKDLEDVLQQAEAILAEKCHATDVL